MDLGFQEVSSVFNTNTFSKQAWLKLQIWLKQIYKQLTL